MCNRRTNHRTFVFSAALLTTVSLTSFMASAQAGLVELQGGIDKPDFFRRGWNWDFAPGAEAWPPPAPNPPALNWQVSLAARNSGVVPGGLAKDLTVRARHLVAPHAGDAVPGPQYSDNAPSLSRPAAGTDQSVSVSLLRHPTQNPNQPHYDLFRQEVRMQPVGTPSQIQLEGKHYGSVPKVSWSFEPYRPGNLSVIATYPSATPKIILLRQITQGEVGKPPITREVPKSDPDAAGARQDPTDLHISFTGSGTTTTHLFFGGSVDGVLGQQVELGLGTDIYLGMDEYLAPMFLDSLESTNLSIDVDLTQWLTQWLASPDLFLTGEQFSVVDGLVYNSSNTLLQGIRVNEILSSGDLSSWQHGTVQLAGRIDGKRLPEPSTVWLLTLIGLGAGLNSWRRGRLRA